MKIVLSHITGNANVKAAANGFSEAQLLNAFYVSLATFPGSTLDKLAAMPVFSELRRRQFRQDLQPVTHFWPWLEIGRVLMPKLKMPSLVASEGAPFHIDTVCKNFDRHVASRLKAEKNKGASAVYAYEDIAEFTFREAKKNGLTCLYDLPIGYWRAAKKLLADEQQRWPEYFATLTGFGDNEQKVARKDAELAMADKIFVASSFTAKTLQYYPGQLAPVHVVPYGFPPASNLPRHYLSKSSGRRLKLLFVGSLSQRKGIAEMFAAADQLKQYVELTIVGAKTVEDCKAVNYELAKHKWIPSLSHDKILQLMRQHDVFVFPSLFEGFGLVITEAMSQGTPVITTDRTAGPDIIKHDHDGWIIEAGSTEALVVAIEKLLQSPERVGMAGQNALETASKRPWQQYGLELAAAVCNN